VLNGLATTPFGGSDHFQVAFHFTQSTVDFLCNAQVSRRRVECQCRECRRGNKSLDYIRYRSGGAYSAAALTATHIRLVVRDGALSTCTGIRSCAWRTGRIGAAVGRKRPFAADKRGTWAILHQQPIQHRCLIATTGVIFAYAVFDSLVIACDVDVCAKHHLRDT